MLPYSYMSSMTHPSPVAPDSPERHHPAQPTLDLRLHTIDADPLDEITREAFQEEVSMFFRAQKRYLSKALEDRVQNPQLQARINLEKDLVENAEFRQTGDLSDILLNSPTAASIQERLDLARDALRNTEEGSIEWHHQKRTIKTLTRAIMPYNHKIRDFLLENGFVLDFETMHQWISRAMGEKSATSGRIMAGFQAEVGFFLLLEEEGFDVRMSTIDEDLEDIDVVYQSASGLSEKINVKTGGNQGDGIAKGRVKQVNIEREWLDGFSIKPEFKQSVLRQLEDD